MRAANRQRPSDDEEAPPEVVKPVEKPIEEEPEQMPEEPKLAEAEVVVDVPGREVLPISERAPATPLTPDEARKRTFENMVKIQEAMWKCLDQLGQTPTPYSVNASKFKTLSWRVELLPYLGYHELYKKFDREVPWNREPNKSLLQFIPDEYVSPERFDTKTNYLLPAGPGFLFERNAAMSNKETQGTDGKANTIMLVEANDSLAVEWTAPEDYIPKNPDKMLKELGGLRGDGVFALWGDGFPVLLAEKLTPLQVVHAFTIEQGDGQLAGDIHRDITIAKTSDAAVASMEPEKIQVSVTATAKPQQVVEELLPRPPVPLAPDLANAQRRLVELFAEKIKDADEDKEKSKLVEEMLKMSAGMPGDLPGAYVLQSAAAKLAIEAGDIERLLQAVDQRVVMFEVDAYEENMSQMLAFGQGNLSREGWGEAGTPFLERSLPVMYAGLVVDDYVRIATIARYSYRFIDQEPDELIPRYLNRLRGLFGSAKREYDALGDVMEIYRERPNDGDNASTIGRYLAFIKGDWASGIPLLAKGGNKTLMELSQLDLQGGTTAEQWISIADAWWEIAEKTRLGVYRQAAMDRAVVWYSQAYQVMPDSLDKVYVKTRMDSAQQSERSSPMAILKQLADETKVDLSVSLASVANNDVKRSIGPDEEE